MLYQLVIDYYFIYFILKNHKMNNPIHQAYLVLSKIKKNKQTNKSWKKKVFTPFLL